MLVVFHVIGPSLLSPSTPHRQQRSRAAGSPDFHKRDRVETTAPAADRHRKMARLGSRSMKAMRKPPTRALSAPALLLLLVGCAASQSSGANNATVYVSGYD